MPRFAANLTLMFTEWPFLDRFAAAADAGFGAVEIQFPYEHSADQVARKLADAGLTAVLFNVPAGDFAGGERGFAALPDRFADLQASVDVALRYAAACGVTRLHLMAGLADRSDPQACAAYRNSVAWAAARCAREGVDVMLEPINLRDMPGYFLNDFEFADGLIEEFALPNLKLQFDIYHRQLMHGDVAEALRQRLPRIGHIQVAGVPFRHEPDADGELNFPYLFAELDRLGYDGFVGCEYRPRAGTIDGLGWFAAHAGRGRS